MTNLGFYKKHKASAINGILLQLNDLKVIFIFCRDVHVDTSLFILYVLLWSFVCMFLIFSSIIFYLFKRKTTKVFVCKEFITYFVLHQISVLSQIRILQLHNICILQNGFCCFPSRTVAEQFIIYRLIM